MNRRDKEQSDPNATLLFQKLIQEELTESEGMELLSILENTPGAGRELFEQLYYDFNLCRVFKHEKSLKLFMEIDRLAQSYIGAAPLKPARGFARTPAFRRGATALCAVVLFCGLLFYFLPGPSPPTRVSRPAPGPAPIAVLSGSVEAVWKDDSPVPGMGNALGRAGVFLESGLAELLFYNGVRVVLEGPAELSVLGSGEVFSRRGSLSVNVPPSGKGFLVQTPHAVLVDYGTEFHVRIASESTETEVIRGKVLVRYNSGKTRLLETGETYQVGAGDAPAGSTYVSSSEMQRRFEAHAETGLLRRDGRAAIDRSGSLRLEFFGDEPLPRQIRHFGGETVAGRDESKRAFRFKSRSDRLEWDVRQKYGSMTLSAWVRLEEAGIFGNPILTSHDKGRGSILWQIGASGCLCLGVRTERGATATIYESPVLLFPDHYGHWVHVASVFDASRQTVEHYMNGRIVSRHPMDAVVPISLETLDVGNRNVDGPIGSWNGCIESVRIDCYALEPEEVLALY